MIILIVMAKEHCCCGHPEKHYNWITTSAFGLLVMTKKEWIAAPLYRGVAHDRSFILQSFHKLRFRPVRDYYLYLHSAWLWLNPLLYQQRWVQHPSSKFQLSCRFLELLIVPVFLLFHIYYVLN